MRCRGMSYPVRRGCAKSAGRGAAWVACGARVVYYNQLADGRIVLLVAYTKAKFDNLPTEFLLALKKEFDDA